MDNMSGQNMQNQNPFPQYQHQYPQGYPQNFQPQYRPQPPQYPQYNFTPKAPDTFSTLDFVFALISAVLGIAFSKFVLFNMSGFFMTAFYVVMLICAYVFIRKKDFKISASKTAFWAVMLIFTIPFSITANYFIKFLLATFLTVCGVYWVFSACKKIPFNKAVFINAFIAIFEVPFSKFGAIYKAIFKRNSKSGAKNLIFALIGIICAFPFTVFIGKLLMEADDNMAKLMNNIFGNLTEKIFSNIFIILVGIPIAMYLFGMLYANTKTDSNIKPSLEENVSRGLQNSKFIPNAFTFAFVTPVCVLYALYFAIQIKYFISAFMNILPENFTYANYARQGFFELFAVAVVNALVILCMNIFSKSENAEKNTGVKVYTVIFCIFTLVLIASALSKMVMYMNTYGLTPLRLYTSWFMVLLALCFIAVTIKEFAPKFSIVKSCAVIFVVMFALLTFSCPDAIIAKTNIDMYKSGKTKELDASTLINLSDDAWVIILDNEDAIKKQNDYKYFNFYEDMKYKKEDLDKFYQRMSISSQIVYNKLSAK